MQGRIGFADRYLVGQINPQLARQQAQADTTRQRRNFELHVRLQAPLLAWYAALAQALPGRVQVGFPAALPTVERREGRYAVTAFDRLIAALAAEPAYTV